MTEASVAYQQGGTLGLERLDWDRVLAKAMARLSEPQFTAFRNAVIQIRNMTRLRELARRE